MSELRKFTADVLLGDSLKTEPLLLVGEVFDDGDHLMIRPLTGAEGLFRLPAAAVDVGKAPAGLEDAPQDFRWLKIDPDAPCVKMISARARQLLSPATRQALAVKKVTIAFGASGEGTLTYASKACPCLGNPGLKYVKDLTVKGVVGTDKFPIKHSVEYDVDMYWAVLIMGDRGIYIHEGGATIAENGGAPSAGCIHLGEDNANAFYDWVDGPTRVVISYPW